MSIDENPCLLESESPMKRENTVAQIIATVTPAKANCAAAGNTDWLHKWGDILEYIEKNVLPSGSGFDNGTTIESADSRMIKLSTAFHHMDDAGYYDGWTEHTVTVRAEFGGFDIAVSGRNRNDIKDYIAETFHHVLSNPLSDADWNCVQEILAS